MVCRFDRDLISLLDRGFIYAIAHVRGGGELGRQWSDSSTDLHHPSMHSTPLDL